jgi:hypothetical protein
MENQKEPLLNREDDLLAENNLLKLKLGIEFGMQMGEARGLDPGLQNEWLKSVYAFEQNFKDAKRIKLYDYIGRPTFAKWNTLTPEETRKELERMELLMENNGVQLGCLCKYDDAIIYKFITEELFEHEMDDMRIAGMTCHFTYEEFHPNHDYDLRKQASRFVEAVFTRPWDEEFDGVELADKVSFSGKPHDRRSISSIIGTFQEAHGILTVERMDITHVGIDDSVTKANVHATLSVSGKMKHGDNVRYEGRCTFQFVKPDEYWYVKSFDIPGFTRKA